MPANGTLAIGNFAAGDTIDLRGLGFTSSETVSFSSGSLTVGNGSATETLTLGSAPKVLLVESDGHGGTDIVAFNDLSSAIAAVDAQTSGSFLIELNGNETETADPTAINLRAGVSLTIDGNGATLDGGAVNGVGGHRGLFVYSGNVTIENLTLANMNAIGGAGVSGGGGGAGLGGGLFVANNSGADANAVAGNVSLINVNFVNDGAVGGAGGGNGNSGGGGGLGGAGGHVGAAHVTGGGGGGIGSGAKGANGGGQSGGTGIVVGAAGGGSAGSFGGGSDGGGGAGGNQTTAGEINSGGATSYGGGGGGIGGGAGHLHIQAGNGGFGGGSGGGQHAHGGFGGGGGGNSSGGGGGGFGGGGGGGDQANRDASSGFGAGMGNHGGGGGLGAGGDIFVMQGATLTISGGTLGQGSVTAGQSQGDGASGQAYGKGIFIQGNESVTFGTGQTSGQTTTISGDITDQSGSDTANTYNQPASGHVVVAGDGTVVLGGNNSFTGGLKITGGTLELASAHAAGSGAIVFDARGRSDAGILAGECADERDRRFHHRRFHQDRRLHGAVRDLLPGPSRAHRHGCIGGPGDGHSRHARSAAVEFPHRRRRWQHHAQLRHRRARDRRLLLPGHADRNRRQPSRPWKRSKIGDEVMTMSGALRPIKWIGRRSYGGRFVMGRKDILPICFKAGSLGDNVPKRDLWISPHHAMYLQGVLIEARDLVNGVSIVQAEQVEKVEYFHIELDSHDVIIAEGSLSETFVDDNSRGIFHNAHEYPALYPDAEDMPARYCAPRRSDGYEVETARRLIDARAGLQALDQTPRIDTLRGYIDASVRGRSRAGRRTPSIRKRRYASTFLSATR